MHIFSFIYLRIDLKIHLLSFFVRLCNYSCVYAIIRPSMQIFVRLYSSLSVYTVLRLSIQFFVHPCKFVFCFCGICLHKANRYQITEIFVLDQNFILIYIFLYILIISIYLSIPYIIYLSLYIIYLSIQVHEELQAAQNERMAKSYDPNAFKV